MKLKFVFLIIMLALVLPAAGHTQSWATAIDSLFIELWPDYDRTSVLVLLTGTLPDNTKLPATVTLPVPETAQLNAVARIDISDGKMKDDIISSPTPDGIRFTTPDLRFRLEYYLPYSVNNSRRTFNFTWLAGLSVNRFQLRVQQPISASSLVTEPAAIDVLKAEGGLTYHAFPVQAVPAGQSFSVRVDYTMTTAQLSVKSLAPPNTRAQEPGLPPTSNTATGINRPIAAVVLGGILIVIVFVWRITAGRGASSRPTPDQAKAKKQSRAKFCRNCGNPVYKDDKFCRNCGTALQG